MFARAADGDDDVSALSQDEYLWMGIRLGFFERCGGSGVKNQSTGRAPNPNGSVKVSRIREYCSKVRQNGMRKIWSSVSCLSSRVSDRVTDRPPSVQNHFGHSGFDFTPRLPSTMIETQFCATVNLPSVRRVLGRQFRSHQRPLFLSFQFIPLLRHSAPKAAV